MTAPYTRLTRLLAGGAAWLFVASGFMLSFEVVARYFFTRPTIWAAELSQLCLIWGCLLGMPWVLSARRHIQITALTSLLPRVVARWLEVLVMLVIACLSVVIVVKGWDIFYDSFERGRTTGSLLDLPSWVAELAVPVGFGLLLLQAVAEAKVLLGGRHQDRVDDSR